MHVSKLVSKYAKHVDFSTTKLCKSAPKFVTHAPKNVQNLHMKTSKETTETSMSNYKFFSNEHCLQFGVDGSLGKFVDLISLETGEALLEISEALGLSSRKATMTPQQREWVEQLKSQTTLSEPSSNTDGKSPGIASTLKTLQGIIGSVDKIEVTPQLICQIAEFWQISDVEESYVAKRLKPQV
jgi:hypothetical protein